MSTLQTALKPAPLRRKNLIILRAGDASLHRGWIADGARDFDLLISYYGQQPDLHKEDADHYEMRRGPKWSCIADLLRENPELIQQYEAFWFPDDDLSASTETLNRMFALFHGFNLALAQPALTADSYYSWSTLLQKPEYVMRHVGFVEVMAPLFERQALRACVSTFGESRSGWGLDWVWPTLAGKGRDDAIAILDATPVKHTRPLGGDLYRNNPDMDPRKDEKALLERYQLQDLRYTGKYQLNSVITKTQAHWRLRLKMWLGLVNSRRRQRRQARKSGA